MRNEAVREYYPSPAKKQRVDYYQESERRPVPKPVQKIPEPKAAPVIIEKRPVLFNAAPNNVTEYHPLPQRKPVQKPPKVVSQTQPIKTVAQPTRPVVQNQPTKSVQNQPTKPVQNQPMKPVGQSQPMKPVVQNQPTKPVVQNQPTKPVVQKQPPKPVVEKQMIKPTVKPVQTPPVKQQKQTPQVVEKKQDIKSEPVKAEAVSPAEPCPAGWSQLDGPTSQALSEELELIMDAVAKELPKESPTPAERYVVKQFRTAVGDEIRNALGLNVTKRLLNLHNPLYVKLQFSGKPEAGCLQPFISAYNLRSFKRIESPADTFAARLDAVADFDRLCAAGELACGSARVTVTPCYKYLACPPMLKTIYGTYTEPIKLEKQDANTPQEKTAEDVSTNHDQKVTVAQEVVHKATDQKVSVKQEVNEATVSDNSMVAIKKEVNETNNEIEAETVTDTNAKTVAESPVKVNITIQAVSNKGDVNTVSKELNEINILKETDELAIIKTNVVNKSNKQVENISKVDDSGEGEMNDQDILALMSGGIVLDECSGSDDEKLNS